MIIVDEENNTIKAENVDMKFTEIKEHINLLENRFTNITWWKIYIFWILIFLEYLVFHWGILQNITKRKSSRGYLS